MERIEENTLDYFNLFLNDELSYKELKEAAINNEIDVLLFDNLLEEFHLTDKHKKMFAKMALHMAAAQAARLVAGYPGMATYIAGSMLYKHLKHKKEKVEQLKRLHNLDPKRNILNVRKKEK